MTRELVDSMAASRTAKIAATLFALFLACSPSFGGPRHWYSSKKFWVAFGVSAAAMTADYRTSQAAFSRGAVESNPIFGASRPSMGRMVAIGLPLEFLYAYGGERMSESEHSVVRDASWIPSAFSTAQHVELSIHNSELDDRTAERLCLSLSCRRLERK